MLVIVPMLRPELPGEERIFYLADQFVCVSSSTQTLTDIC